MKNKVPMLIATVLFISFSSGMSQPSSLAHPSAWQLAFQDLELGVFIHYSIDTYCADGAALHHPLIPQNLTQNNGFWPLRLWGLPMLFSLQDMSRAFAFGKQKLPITV
jgi:hypothetical protein